MMKIYYLAKTYINMKTEATIKPEVTIKLSIGEIHSLMKYHRECANNYPSFDFDARMLSGKLAREHVKEHLYRVTELRRILNETWPK